MSVGVLFLSNHDQMLYLTSFKMAADRLHRSSHFTASSFSDHLLKKGSVFSDI